MKYARPAHIETQIVPGRQASDRTVPQLTERHFLRNVAPKTEKSKPQRRCGCAQSIKKKTSVYCCQICDVGHSLEDCFELDLTCRKRAWNDARRAIWVQTYT